MKGRIISTDAMHTQKKWCACVQAYQGYYLTIVKKNQPQMYEDLVDFFDDAEAERHEWRCAKSVQKGHGRLEVRELWSSTQMNEWFETEWAGIAQVFRLRRQVKDGDKEREEVVYGLTNLPRKKANAWEDACQVRMAGAPQALAALNGGVLALMDWLHVSNVASQMRHFCAHPEQSLQLLCGKLLR